MGDPGRGVEGRRAGMKLKKVVSLCLGAEAFRLYDKLDATGGITQWLGDGYAIYPLEGLPILDEQTLFAVFDIPERKREKVTFSQMFVPDVINVGDFDDDEREVEDNGVSINFGGTVVKPLQTRDGILYIQSRYLAPLEDVADVLHLFERETADGRRYVVAKVGMLTTAVIFPYDLIKEGFVSKLSEIVELTRAELDRKKFRESMARSELEDRDQETMFDEEGKEP